MGICWFWSCSISCTSDYSICTLYQCQAQKTYLFSVRYNPRTCLQKMSRKDFLPRNRLFLSRQFARRHGLRFFRGITSSMLSPLTLL
jgi:hypothetical protein